VISGGVELLVEHSFLICPEFRYIHYTGEFVRTSPWLVPRRANS
jgi:hypothetical protein